MAGLIKSLNESSVDQPSTLSFSTPAVAFSGVAPPLEVLGNLAKSVYGAPVFTASFARVLVACTFPGPIVSFCSSTASREA